MADSKISELDLGLTAPEYVYGLHPTGINRSRKYHAKQVVNVRDFGPDDGTNIGNGVYDCTSIIQAAINAAFGTMPGSPNGQDNPELNKELYFPPGNYVVEGPLYIVNTKGAKIYGAGQGTSQLFFQANGSEGNTLGPDLGVTPIFCLDGCSDITISDLSIGNSGTQGTLPISTYDTSDSTASGTTLEFTDTTYIKQGCLVYNYDNPDSITDGTRVASVNPNVSIELDTAVASAVASGNLIYFVTSNVAIYLFESGENGESSNLVIRSCIFSNFGVAVLVGGTTGCANGVLIDVQIKDGQALAGLRLENPEALNWSVIGGGASQVGGANTYRAPMGAGATRGNYAAAYSVVEGQIAFISGMSTSIAVDGDNPATVGTIEGYAKPVYERPTECGWAIVNGGGYPLSVFGGRLETCRGVVSIDGSNIALNGIILGNTSELVGLIATDCTFGGSITCVGCFLSPSEVPEPFAILCALGSTGQIVFRECSFINAGTVSGFSGSPGSTVSIINCNVGGSVGGSPAVFSFTEAFGSFTGRVLECSPFTYNVEFGDLPTAAAKYTGLRGVITNCSTAAFMADADGSGALVVPTFCDGDDWKVA